MTLIGHLPARYAASQKEVWVFARKLRAVKINLLCFCTKKLTDDFVRRFATLARSFPTDGGRMKLTILPLQHFSAQDRIDLQKIWPDEDISALATRLNSTHRVYAARFNDRLLAALQLEIAGTQGKIRRLNVRDVTRRRGVGGYLLEETLTQNPSVDHWWVADDGYDEQQVIAAFMQACDFRAQADGWVKNVEHD